MNVLITGCAGFIGFHLYKKLIELNYNVFGIDNIDDYYDISLKLSRIKELEIICSKFEKKLNFIESDINDENKLVKIFKSLNPTIVIHLAAQAGVRYSLINPKKYINTNLLGFSNVIQCCKESNIKHFVYASSSSVYGGNVQIPFKETDGVDHPVSLYAATKKSNELIAHVYSHLYNFPTTGLRFFTVYGPWGRPDMALFKFTKAILEGKSIDIYNNGDMIRDFTYIDDVITSVIKIINKYPEKNLEYSLSSLNPSSSWAPYKIFNIGNSKPASLMDYIFVLEKVIGKKAIKNFLPNQPGEVIKTFADTTELEKWISYKPKTTIEEGIKSFVDWYRLFYDY